MFVKVNQAKAIEASQSVGTVGGLNVLFAATFVAAEMAGSGILAIPKAVVDCSKINYYHLFVKVFVSI